MSKTPNTRVLTWVKPAHARATEVHNAIFQSDSGVAGTYVPNMTKEEQLRWKAKHIKGADPRVEIRKRIGSALVLWVVRKDGIQMSTNGKILFENYTDWLEMETAVAEALHVVRHG